MSADLASGPSLEFLAEPALLVRRDGTILAANAAVRRLFTAEPVGSTLSDLSSDPRPDLEVQLRRASASTAPVIGALTLETMCGHKRMRLHAARFGGAGDDRLVLRFVPTEASQFEVLNNKIQELDHQLRLRQQEKMALQEALHLNRTLVDELQHRVKNNIQIMMSLIRLSALGRTGSDVTDVVEKARLRLQAMASTQEAVYRSRKQGRVRSGAFLKELISSIGETLGVADALRMQLADVELNSEHAHCLALIVNELVTNAVKHGLRGRDGTIRVLFAEHGDTIELTVSDNGSGMPEDAGQRNSGLHLVRSLCRQIGGRLDIIGGEGACCMVRFGKPEERRP